MQVNVFLSSSFEELLAFFVGIFILLPSQASPSNWFTKHFDLLDFAQHYFIKAGWWKEMAKIKKKSDPTNNFEPENTHTNFTSVFVQNMSCHSLFLCSFAYISAYTIIWLNEKKMMYLQQNKNKNMGKNKEKKHTHSPSNQPTNQKLGMSAYFSANERRTKKYRRKKQQQRWNKVIFGVSMKWNGMGEFVKWRTFSNDGLANIKQLI